MKYYAREVLRWFLLIVIYILYSCISLKESSDLILQNGVFVVMVLWLLDLQLPMQSVPIIATDVSSHPALG